MELKLVSVTSRFSGSSRTLAISCVSAANPVGVAGGVVRGSEEGQPVRVRNNSGASRRGVNLWRRACANCFDLASSTYFSMMMTE